MTAGVTCVLHKFKFVGMCQTGSAYTCETLSFVNLDFYAMHRWRMIYWFWVANILPSPDRMIVNHVRAEAFNNLMSRQKLVHSTVVIVAVKREHWRFRTTFSLFHWLLLSGKTGWWLIRFWPCVPCCRVKDRKLHSYERTISELVLPWKPPNVGCCAHTPQVPSIVWWHFCARARIIETRSNAISDSGTTTRSTASPLNYIWKSFPAAQRQTCSFHLWFALVQPPHGTHNAISIFVVVVEWLLKIIFFLSSNCSRLEAAWQRLIMCVVCRCAVHRIHHLIAFLKTK